MDGFTCENVINWGESSGELQLNKSYEWVTSINFYFAVNTNKKDRVRADRWT